MLDAFLKSLPIAAGTLVATLPLIGVSLLLVARPERGPYLAFLSGWIAGGMLTGSVAVLLSDLSTPGRQAPADWVVWLRLALGAVLIGLAVRKWLRRSKSGDKDDTPPWMQRFETMPGRRTFLLGAALVALNPKNAVLFASGALAIASATYDPAAQVLALAGFALVASLGVAAPLVLTILMGERAQAPLAVMKGLIARHSATILCVVLAALGLLVILGALEDL